MNPGVTGVVLGAQTAARKKPYVSIDVRDKMWNFQNFADFSSQSANVIAYDAMMLGSSAMLGYIDVTGGVNVKVIGAAAATASANWNLTGFTTVATGARNSGDATIAFSKYYASDAQVFYTQKANATSTWVSMYSESNDAGATWSVAATAVNAATGTTDDFTFFVSPIVGENGVVNFVNYYNLAHPSAIVNLGRKSIGGSQALKQLPSKYYLTSANASGRTVGVAFVDKHRSDGTNYLFVANKLSGTISGANIYSVSYDGYAADWLPIHKVLNVESPVVGSFIGNKTYISGLRGSIINNEYYLTYAHTDSLATTFRYIKSTDLEHWTAPYVFSSDIWGMDNFSKQDQVPYNGGFLLGLGNTAFTWDCRQMAAATMYVSSHTQKNLSLSADALNYTIAKGNMGGKIIIEVANSGKYVGPSPSAPGYQALKRDAEVYVQEGWVTNASGAQMVPEGLYYIDSVEQVTTPTEDRIRITARDKFKHINNYVAETLIPYDNQQFAAGRLDDPKSWNKTSSQAFNTATYSIPMVAGDQFWWQQQLRDGGYGMIIAKQSGADVRMNFQYVDLSNHYKVILYNDNSAYIQQWVDNAATNICQAAVANNSIIKIDVIKDELSADLYINNTQVANFSGITIDHEIGAFGIYCASGSATLYDAYAYENYPQRSVGWMLDDIAYKSEFSISTANQQNIFSDPLSSLTGWTSYATANGTWNYLASSGIYSTTTTANSPFMLINNNSVLLSANQNEPSNGRIDVDLFPDIDPGDGAGLITCASDSANFLLGQVSRGSAFIKKCVGGVYSTLGYANIGQGGYFGNYVPFSFIVDKDWVTMELDRMPMISVKLTACSLTGQKIGFWANSEISSISGTYVKFSGSLKVPTLYQPVPPTCMFPGQDGLTFMEQIASMQDARCFSRYDGTFAAKKCAESGTVQRTYYNEVESGGEYWNDQKYNHVIVVGGVNTSGAPAKAQAFNFTKIAAAGNALRTYFVYDQNLTSNNACQQRADEMIASFGNTYQYVPLHIWRDVGLEPFDTVSVIDTRSSYQTGTFNVYGLQKRYDARMMQYDELLNLGNFTDQATQGLGRGAGTPTQNVGFGTPIAPTESPAASNTGTTTPTQTPASTSPTQGRTHTVVSGDTLWDLAQKYYGNPWEYGKIYEANRDKINDPHWIYPGQVLRIP